MKNENWQAGLNALDASLVEQHLKETERLEKRRKSRGLRFAALAACFCLVLGSVLTLPLLQKQPETPFVDSEPSGEPSEGYIEPPFVGPVLLGDAVTGTQSVTVGRTEFGHASELLVPPGFQVGTVVEARVEEVLPDVYLRPGINMTYWVAKLEVLDVIRGEGLPQTIYLRFCHQKPPFYQLPGKNYGRDLFDGYSSLILSLEQVGIENYLLVNRDQGRAEYFPHMFDFCFLDLPDYGAVVPFAEGKAVYDLWDAGYGWGYPAEEGDSVAQVKEKVQGMIAEGGENLPSCKYFTAEEVFASEEGKAVLGEVAPGQGTLFCHTFWVNRGVPEVTYARYVNGVPTGEWVRVYPERVERSGVWLTREELETLPDIGSAVATLDVSKLAPPHVSLLEGDRLQGYNVQGFYRRAGGEFYGILRVIWTYERPGKGFLQDDCYFLYDCHGNARTVEREELREIIGDDGLICPFSYDPIIVCI